MDDFDDRVLSLLQGIRVVRRFRPQPIEDEVLQKLLNVARWTGSAKNRQPWRFVIVRNQSTREALAACSIRRFASPLDDAPLAIVLVQRPDGYEFDIGRLTQTIIIAATILGLGSCPVSLYDEARARELLNVPPDHHCRFSVALGYPLEEEEQVMRERIVPDFLPVGRLPLEKLIHLETFTPQRE